MSYYRLRPNTCDLETQESQGKKEGVKERGRVERPNMIKQHNKEDYSHQPPPGLHQDERSQRVKGRDLLPSAQPL